MIVAVLAMISSVKLPLRLDVSISIAVALCAIITCTFCVYRKKQYSKPEIVYIISWQALLSANMLNILAGVQILEYNLSFMLLSKVGILLLVILFLLSLSERIN